MLDFLLWELRKPSFGAPVIRELGCWEELNMYTNVLRSFSACRNTQGEDLPLTKPMSKGVWVYSACHA